MFHSKMGKASPCDLLTEFCLRGVLPPSFFLFAQMCSNFPAQRSTPGPPSSQDGLTPRSRETRGVRPPKRGLQFPRSFPRASLLPQSSSHTHSRAPTGQCHANERYRGRWWTDGGTERQTDRWETERQSETKTDRESRDRETEKNRERNRERQRQTETQRLTETDRDRRQSTGEPRARRTALPKGHAHP